MADTSPLDADARTRFRMAAGTIDFSTLDPVGQLAATALLGTILSNDTALANAPLAVDNTPGLSAPVKRIFEAAFAAARIRPTMANGAEVPNRNTVIAIACIVGALMGIGLAVLVID